MEFPFRGPRRTWRLIAIGACYFSREPGPPLYLLTRRHHASTDADRIHAQLRARRGAHRRRTKKFALVTSYDTRRRNRPRYCNIHVATRTRRSERVTVLRLVKYMCASTWRQHARPRAPPSLLRVCCLRGPQRSQWCFSSVAEEPSTGHAYSKAMSMPCSVGWSTYGRNGMQPSPTSVGIHRAIRPGGSRCAWCCAKWTA